MLPHLRFCPHIHCDQGSIGREVRMCRCTCTHLCACMYVMWIFKTNQFHITWALYYFLTVLQMVLPSDLNSSRVTDGSQYFEQRVKWKWLSLQYLPWLPALLVFHASFWCDSCEDSTAPASKTPLLNLFYSLPCHVRCWALISLNRRGERSGWRRGEGWRSGWRRRMVDCFSLSETLGW